jgi:asparagine synthase (glutamine-hydrolysing)
MEPNTIFAEISSVNAGAILTIDLDQISITEDQWMQNDESNHKTIPNSYHANLPEALDDTISSHMVSDCEINFFLSAGLDSTLLVDRARNLKHKNNIYTTTLGFSDYSGSKNDETIWANLNSVNMGVKNKCVLLNSDELKESVIEYFNAMDQPTLDGFNTYLISKSAKMDQFKVSISGVGADEIFQGYPSFFQISFLMNFKKYIPLSSIIWWIIGCATFLYGCLNGNEKLRYLHKFRLDLIDLYILRRCYSLSHLFKNGCKDLDRYRRKFSSVIDEQDDVVSSIRKLEISIYMKNQLLRDTDWASMANSHEIRTPFVDKVFFKNVLKIEKKKGIKFSKSSLKSLFSSIIDKRFLNRKKTGFSTPLKTISQDCFDVKINSRNDWTNFILNRYLENWKS